MDFNKCALEGEESKEVVCGINKFKVVKLRVRETLSKKILLEGVARVLTKGSFERVVIGN
jgi:hypothetical protein